MTLKNRIQKMFRPKPFTLALLDSIGLKDGLVKNENGSAFWLEIKQANWRAEIKIPIDVFEIYIDLEIEGKRLSGWDEYYGPSKVEDYRQKLAEIMEVKQNKAQITVEGDTVYFEKNGQKKDWFLITLVTPKLV